MAAPSSGNGRKQRWWLEGQRLPPVLGAATRGDLGHQHRCGWEAGLVVASIPCSQPASSPPLPE